MFFPMNSWGFPATCALNQSSEHAKAINEKSNVFPSKLFSFLCQGNFQKLLSGRSCRLETHLFVLDLHLVLIIAVPPFAAQTI